MHTTMLHAVCAPPCTTVRKCTPVKASAMPCVSVMRAGKTARRQLSVTRAVQVATTTADADAVETAYLTARTNIIRQHFDGALSVDDFFARVEVALAAYGFTGDNTIACSNVCRDEITITAKNKIDAIFGSSFNTNGLGGVLTCGVTGFKAGLSHSPICGSGKERYTFFSFPHISIDAAGNVGAISRPGRPGASCACGALIGSLVQIKEAGLAASCKKPGVHDYADPELSILKQRLARRMRYEGWTEQQVQEMDLVDITKIAERTISDDLEYLVKNAVNPTKADYAVVTGVQIHNYGTEFDNAEPNLEYIWPTGIYVVVNGEKTYIDLDSIPALTPRMLSTIAAAASQRKPTQKNVVNCAGVTTARSIDAPFLYSSSEEIKAKQARAAGYAAQLGDALMDEATASSWPSWQSRIAGDEPEGRGSSVMLDEMEKPNEDVDAITAEFVERLRNVAAQQLRDQQRKQNS